MKVWAYYAKPKDVFPNAEDVKDTESHYGKDAMILYAVTPSKSDAKIFRSMRNMNIFQETVLDLTDIEWEHLIGDNRDCMLEKHKLWTGTHPKDTSCPAELCEVDVLLTFMEYTDIENGSDLSSIVFTRFMSGHISPLGILQVPILKSLYKLHYWDLLNFVREWDVTHNTELIPWTSMDDHLYELSYESSYSLHVDELEYFVHNYSHTLSIS